LDDESWVRLDERRFYFSDKAIFCWEAM